MIKITERTINDEIDDMIEYKLQQIVTPRECTIKKIYEDGCTDIMFEDGGILKYVKTIGEPTVNAVGIVIFVDNDTAKPYCISF